MVPETNTTATKQFSKTQFSFCFWRLLLPDGSKKKSVFLFFTSFRLTLHPYLFSGIFCSWKLSMFTWIHPKTTSCNRLDLQQLQLITQQMMVWYFLDILNSVQVRNYGSTSIKTVFLCYFMCLWKCVCVVCGSVCVYACVHAFSRWLGWQGSICRSIKSLL